MKSFVAACKFGDLGLMIKANSMKVPCIIDKDWMLQMGMRKVCERIGPRGKFGHFQIFRYLQNYFEDDDLDGSIMDSAFLGVCYSGNKVMTKVVLLSRIVGHPYSYAFGLFIIAKRKYKKTDPEIIEAILSVAEEDHILIDLNEVFNYAVAHGNTMMACYIYNSGKVKNITKLTFLAACHSKNKILLEWVLRNMNFEWEDLIDFLIKIIDDANKNDDLVFIRLKEDDSSTYDTSISLDGNAFIECLERIPDHLTTYNLFKRLVTRIIESSDAE